MKRIFYFLLLIALVVPAGITTAQETEVEHPPTMFGTSDLADQLVVNLRGKKLLTGRRIAVVPLVDLNDLQTTSDLGRAVSEELASALHFRNYHLAEIRLDDQILMARQVGELVLARTGPERATISRQAGLAALSEKYNLGAFVVGTYSVIPPGKATWWQKTYGQALFNVRLVDPVSGAILAVGSVKQELDEGTAEMAESTSTSVLEPIQTIRQTRF